MCSDVRGLRVSFSAQFFCRRLLLLLGLIGDGVVGRDLEHRAVRFATVRLVGEISAYVTPRGYYVLRCTIDPNPTNAVGGSFILNLHCGPTIALLRIGTVMELSAEREAYAFV